MKRMFELFFTPVAKDGSRMIEEVSLVLCFSDFGFL